MNAARLQQPTTAKLAAFLFLSLTTSSTVLSGDGATGISDDMYKYAVTQSILNQSGQGANNRSVDAVGMAAMHALAGEKARALIFNGSTKSVSEGVKAGLVFRALDPIGDKISETIKQEVGDLWTAIVGGFLRNVKEGMLNGWYWLFNGSAKPFAAAQLGRWKREVLEVVLKDIDRNAKESQRESTTGRNAQMRALFNASGDEDPNAAAEMAREKDEVWIRMVDGYARDLDRLARRLEAHKLYYAPQDDEDEKTFPQSERYDIIQLTNRVQESLRLVKDHILLPSGTLKELAEGEMRYFLPQIRTEIEKRFELLIESVQDYHGGAHQTLSGRQSANTSTTPASSSTTRRPGAAAGASYF